MTHSSSKYQACSQCSAKWFGPDAVTACPRCEGTPLPAMNAAELCNLRRKEVHSAASLLREIPEHERTAVLAEALTDTPPWSCLHTGKLNYRLATEFSANFSTDWWRRVPLAVQSPLKNSTQRLLNSASARPTPKSLKALIAHLKQRCREGQLQSIERVHRTVVRWLRHNDRSHKFYIDPDGWVSVPDLLQRVNHQALDFELWRDWTIADLHRQVGLHHGRRLQINEQGTEIRALYGHTEPDICSGVRQPPPAILYHGTSATQAEQIAQEGIRPRHRALVHLTSSLEYASTVASTHSEPVVLQIGTDHPELTHVSFWQCNDHVWQCPRIPPAAVQVGGESTQ